VIVHEEAGVCVSGARQGGGRGGEHATR